MDGNICIIFLVIFSLHCGHSALWSNSFPDGAIVDACAGDINTTFPWAITLASQEEISDVHWFYRASSEEMIAMFSHGIFFALPSFSQRVQQENVIALFLSHVTESDAGNYSVEVIVRDRSTDATTTLRHNSVLMIYSQVKAIADATVSVMQEAGAVWDNSSGQYYVALSCLYHGRQPPAVTWTLPSGASQVVWTSEGGKFSLLVPNPVSGGNYTCSAHPHTPAARCLPTNSPVLRGDTLYLDKVEARLTLLEAEQQVLKVKNSKLETENSQLKTETSQLKTENSQQASSIQSLQTENSQQATSIGNLQTQLHDMANKRVAFHARLPNILPWNIHILLDERLVLTDVVYNQGDGYNSSTGVFTAPHSGTYTFLATLLPYGSSATAAVYIKVDGTQVNWCHSYISGDSRACDAVVHLNAGQRVWVESAGVGYFAFYGTAFSGFLVSPDP